MSEVLEYAARLSRVIGARPGGTEEEQQASFIIEETLKGHGLETSIEEFNCNPNYELPRIVCCVVSIVLALLAIFLPLMLIPAIIVCAIMAVLYIMEVTGVSPLNNMAKRGISQNVIAKYIPGELEIANEDTGSIAPADAIDINATEEEIEAAEAAEAEGSTKRTRSRGRGRAERGRKRKIIVLARYDSGKVCRELNQPFFKMLTPIRWAEMAGIALIPVSILLRTATSAEGGLLVFWDVLTVLGIICTFLPVLVYIMHQTAPFTDGANNNASGVAVMMEVARRLANGAREAFALGAADAEAEGSKPAEQGTGESGVLAPPIMHGEAAIRESGMLPVDTDLVYHEAAEGDDPRAKVAAEAAAAEALVAEGVVPVSKPEGLVGVAVAGAANVAASAGNTDVRMPQAPEPGAFIPQAPPTPAPPEMDPNLPDWFRKGLKAAKANKEESGEAEQPANIQRSRFADALDAAHEVSANSIQEFEAREAGRSQGAANAASGSANLTESGIDADRLAQLRQSIVESNVAAKAEVAAVAAEIAAAEADAAKQAAQEAQAKEAERAERVAKAKGRSADELTPEEAVSKAGSTLQADVAAAIGEAQAEKAAAQAQAAEEVAEQAAVADRTIAYIPVAADIPAEISASDISDVSAVDTVGKSAADILEEASAKAADDEAVPSKRESNRKKRSISLPSLTGAIDGTTKHQDAPLADDAERDTSERQALRATGRRIRDSLTSLPSTDLPPKDARKKAAAPSASAPASDAADAAPAKAAETVVASREGSTTSFLKEETADAKAALSSLDVPSAQPDGAKVSTAGSFVAPSSTSQFQPVGDELIENAAADDIIIHDADDSDYAENVTHTGAMAGPGYVEMPKSRASRIKNIFSRKKKRESDSISFSEAVGLEDGFDARQVGAARGGWESFQNESAGYDAGSAPVISGEASEATFTAKGRRSHVDEYSTNSRSLRFKDDDSIGNAWDDDDWNGGAFSALRDRIAGDGDGDGDDSGSGSGSEGGRTGRGSAGSRGGEGRSSRASRTSRDGSSRRSSRGASDASRSGRRRSADDVMSEDGRAIGAEDMLEERDQIRSFRTSSAPLASFDEVAAYASTFSSSLGGSEDEADGAADAAEASRPHGFGTEVWFVALGAELADNAGIKDFISKHSDDMRGAVIVDIDALGAGTLSLIDEEGVIRRVKASSRMKRYVTKAGTSLGLHVNSVKMTWRESAAYYTNRKGLQTIHVAGMQDGKPAYLGEIDDKFENLSEEKLLENTAFVLELLNTI